MYIFGWNISQKRMNRSVFPELTKVARKPIEVIVAGRAASMVMLSYGSVEGEHGSVSTPPDCICSSTMRREATYVTSLLINRDVSVYPVLFFLRP